MSKSLRFLPPSLIALALAGCGGSAVAPISYLSLSDSATGTNTLGGIALQSSSATGEYAVVNSSGTVTNPNGPLTITLVDGSSSVTLPTGFTGSSQTDGTATLLADGSQGFTIYDYVQAYEQTYSHGGINYDLPIAIVGVITRGVDMPSSGSASYSGEAIAQIIQQTEGWALTDGSSLVQANFGAGGSVDVTLTGFTATDATGNGNPSPIDTINVANMTLSGGRFSGGTITTELNGTPVNLTGSLSTLTSSGAFFGPATGGAPAEVAGILLYQGSTGTLTAAFIAD